MKRRVPVVDRSVVAAERELEIVVQVIADQIPLHVQGIASRSGRETDLAKYGNLPRNGRGDVKNELAKIESALGRGVVGRREVQVSETAEVKVWKRAFGFGRVGMLGRMVLRGAWFGCLTDGGGGRRGHLRLFPWVGRCRRIQRDLSGLLVSPHALDFLFELCDAGTHLSNLLFLFGWCGLGFDTHRKQQK